MVRVYIKKLHLIETGTELNDSLFIILPNTRVAQAYGEGLSAYIHVRTLVYVQQFRTVSIFSILV